MDNQPVNQSGLNLPNVGAPASDLPAPAAAVNQPESQLVNSPTPSSSQGSGQSANPAIADDGDLIEKDWVNKAKQVLAHTAGDPYLLNQEYTKLRADYMKKRYGKLIKSED